MRAGLPSRRAVLGSLGAAGLLGLRAQAETPPVKLVVVVAAGGWDPTFTIDPRPAFTDGGPYPDLDRRDPYDVEEIADYGEIRLSDNRRRRPNVGLFFDRFADRTAVVNGVWTGSLSHWQAMVQLLTGTPSEQTPDVAAIAGATLGLGGDVIASLDLGGVARFGDLAPWCARAGVGGQLGKLLATGDGWSPSDPDRDAIRQYLDARAASDADPLRGVAALERGVALDRLAAVRARAATLTEALPVTVRNTFGDSVPFIAAALREGLCHAVVANTEVPWDTHADSGRQHRNWDTTFQGLGDLCVLLSEDGLLDRTLIVVLSELGRSPRRNRDDGTDHWTYTSAVLVGAGVAGRRRIAGTGPDLLGVGVDLDTGLPNASTAPIGYASFAAGVLDALGVDPGPWLPGVRPLRAFRG